VLSKSGYFKGMFSGSWKESGDSRIEIDIPDLNITPECKLEKKDREETLSLDIAR